MDWNYIAGFFDGEGNLHAKWVNLGSSRQACQLAVRIYSSDDKVLKEIQEFLKIGKIYLKNKTGVYELTITKKEEVLFFLKNIVHFSIIKKDQIEFLLDNYSFNRNNNLSFNLDQFRGFIKRKNVIRKHHSYNSLS